LASGEEFKAGKFPSDCEDSVYLKPVPFILKASCLLFSFMQLFRELRDATSCSRLACCF
jgi:hypothetical protein